MKIKIIRNDEAILVYHDPHEVIVHPKENTVDIYNGKGIEKTYELVNREVGWIDNDDMDSAEVIITLVVGKTLSDND